jgi:hypothetical protein
MPKSTRPPVTFESTCAKVEAILSSGARAEILGELRKEKTFAFALSRLRDQMRAHRFSRPEGEFSLAREIRVMDERTRADGFHVLKDWDGVADRLNEETIPVDVASFLLRTPVSEGAEPAALKILLDYYFFYVLALLAMRAWDEGVASENLDRIGRMLRALSGEQGSGHRFVGSAETLLPVATSHFEPDVSAFGRLLGKMRRLDEPHRRRLALCYAAILSSHLRFGFQATYGRDVLQMRNDNAPDYPWLLFALGTLVEAYGREDVQGADREVVVEALVNGLLPDPRAFLGTPPPSLAECEDERSRFVERFRAAQAELEKDFEHHRPGDARYSPLAFFFNFPHNLLKAMVVDALVNGKAWNVSLDDLLTGVPPSPSSEERVAVATTLMGYARASPDRIRGRLVPVIVYDPRAGLRAFGNTLSKLNE